MLRSIVLLAAASACVHAEAPQKPAPKRLSGSDWSGIRAEYERHRREATPVDGGYQARNYGQRWMTRFDGRGFDVTSDTAGWRWGLELRSYGFPGQERNVNHARTRADVEKLSYQWDSTMKEWFVNESGGLEHGFTLASRPGNSTAALTLHLTVRGTLTPHVLSDGRWVSFLDERGAIALNYSGLKVTDAEGRELAARFTREPQGLRLEVDEHNAHYPITIDPTVQEAYLKADAVLQPYGDWFGFSVGVSGDTVVVGAPNEASSSQGINMPHNVNAAKSGAVFVFVRSGGGWSQQAYLKASGVGKQDGDMFGFSVAISGDTVVVGAPEEDGSALGVNGPVNEQASDAGAAYVFTRSGTIWTQQAYLKPAGVCCSQVSNEFGHSVAISGDTIVVGADGESSSTLGVNNIPMGTPPQSGAGAAYVFVRNGVTWSQQAYLKPAAVGRPQANNHFGVSVAVSGDNVVVGAYLEGSSSVGVNSMPDAMGIAAGAAYVFHRSGSSWIQEAYLKPNAAYGGNNQANNHFGISVAVSGDTVVVGASQESSSTTGIDNGTPNRAAGSAGAAYVFTRNAGNRSQDAYLKPAAVGTTQAGDFFGVSVAISGDTLVVGASMEDSSTTGINTIPNDLVGGPGTDSGAAYVFARNGGTWSQRAFLKPNHVGPMMVQANDHFGISVAISGDTIAVGANQEDSNTTGVNSMANEVGTDSGAAYVFTFMPPTVNITVNSSPVSLVPFITSGAGCAPGSHYSTSQVLTWTSGSSCQLTVPYLYGQGGSVYLFWHWEDGSTQFSRAITAPDADATYTATLVREFTLTTKPSNLGVIQSAPSNCGTGVCLIGVVDSCGDPAGCGVLYTSGTNVTLAAVPKPGNFFSGWGGACTGTGTCDVMMDADKTVTATFRAPGPASRIGVFRSGIWYLNVNGTGTYGPPDAVFTLGYATSTPVVGDWNGNGHSKTGVFDKGTWYLDVDGDGVFTPFPSGIDRYFQFGSASAIPVVGDWDHTGTTKVGVYERGTWHLDVNNTGNFATARVISFGPASIQGIPVVGDWNGDGRTKVGIFHLGTWYLDTNGDGILNPSDQVITWGAGRKIGTPVVGDWNGDGRTKVGIFLDGVWSLDTNGNGGFDTGDQSFTWGAPGCLPVLGDWNGDGRTKVGAYLQGAWKLDVNGDGVFNAGDLAFAYAVGSRTPLTGTPLVGKW